MIFAAHDQGNIGMLLFNWNLSPIKPTEQTRNFTITCHNIYGTIEKKWLFVIHDKGRAIKCHIWVFHWNISLMKPTKPQKNYI